MGDFSGIYVDCAPGGLNYLQIEGEELRIVFRGLLEEGVLVAFSDAD
jgi:hypothetical protein